VDYDLLVIGSGPGGYVAAIRASQLGMKCGVIERDKPGGVCLNIGCIPSKALIHQAEEFRSIDALKKMGVGIDVSSFDYAKVHKKSRVAADKLSKGVQFLLKKNNIDYIEGDATLGGKNEVTVGKKKLTATNILIATGSRPRELPGFEFDEKQVISSTGALMLTDLPKSLIILGAGAIGMEFAHVMNAFGVEVTVVEMLDQILPLEDPDAAAVLEKDFKRRKITMLTGTKASKLKKTKSGITLEIEGGDPLTADMLLVAVGRSPNSDDLGLEKLGVKTERGFVTVGDYYETSVPGVYAIGDVIASPLLAHVASKEGEMAVEHMAGHSVEARLHPDLIPSAVYTEPQVASFGPTEAQAKERGLSFQTAIFPYRGAGKSVAIEKSEGIVKILYHTETSEILAAHVAGAEATELVHELLLAKKSELLPEDVATMVHAHPTLSESVMEAARTAEGWAIHV
jgi:dihydrolipoamide dehydrogenase